MKNNNNFQRKTFLDKNPLNKKTDIEGLTVSESGEVVEDIMDFVEPDEYLKSEDEKIAKLFKIYRDSDPYGRLKDPDAIASLMDFIAGYKSRQTEITAADFMRKSLLKVIADNKIVSDAEIESMKCCGNCGNEPERGIPMICRNCSTGKWTERNESDTSDNWESKPSNIQS